MDVFRQNLPESNMAVSENTMVEERAWAKINLSLFVTGKRPDGYHTLETLMLPLMLCDDVWVAPAKEHSVDCPGLILPAGAENIAHKAARLYFGAAGLPEGVRVQLQKSIPAGAGLGGGSADAGAVLRALHSLYPVLSVQRLSELAAQIGADVPFCLYAHPAVCTGIGERMRFVAAPELHLVIAQQGMPLSTPEVFAQHDRLSREEKKDILLKLAEKYPKLNYLIDKQNIVSNFDLETSLEYGNLREIAAELHNDLLPAALSLRPEIGRTLFALQSGGPLAVSMSGSGAACFALCRDKAQAAVVADVARSVAPELSFCRAVSTRPGKGTPQLAGKNGLVVQDR